MLEANFRRSVEANLIVFVARSFPSYCRLVKRSGLMVVSCVCTLGIGRLAVVSIFYAGF